MQLGKSSAERQVSVAFDLIVKQGSRIQNQSGTNAVGGVWSNLSPTALVHGKNQPVSEERTTYRAYMLRIWLMENDDCPRWRLSLEEPQGGLIYIFNNPADLIIHLLITLNDSQSGHDK
jgi:hypothetical protein